MRWVLPALTSLVIASPAISDATYPHEEIKTDAQHRVWAERQINTLNARVDTLTYVLHEILFDPKPNVLRLRMRMEQTSCPLSSPPAKKPSLKI